MANNENFIDHINVAYNEYKKYSIFNEDDDINKVSNKMITGYTVLFVLISFILTILESFSLLLSFVLVSSAIPWVSVFTYKFFSKKRSKLEKISYIGRIGEIFDLTHPVMKENKTEILSHLQVNKSLSGSFAFDLYCKIKKYDDEKIKKLTVNDLVYDEAYIENMIIQNCKDFENSI